MRKMIMMALGMAIAGSTFAAFTGVSSAAALGANDYIDLNQFGPDFSVIADGTAGVTNLGLAFTISSCDNFSVNDGRGLEMRTEGASWSGVFNAGDRIIWHQGDNNPISYIKIAFASNVLGVGTTGQSNRFGDFRLDTIMWNSYPNAFIGTNSTFGNNTAAAAYSGGYDTSATINEFYVTAYMNDPTGAVAAEDTLGFGIGRIDVKTVPEPASMAALGLGAVALIRRRRK